MVEESPLIGFVASVDTVAKIPSGVRPVILSELLDIVRRKGVMPETDAQASIIYFSYHNADVGVTYYDFGYSSVDGPNSLSVCKCEPDGTRSTPIRKPSVFLLKNGTVVVWDRSVSAEEAREFIRRVRGIKSIT